MTRLSLGALLVPALVMGCAQVASNMQGPLQPQAVSGPCQMNRFLLLDQRAVPAKMSVANTGEACSFLLYNWALNLTLTGALINAPPSHGRADAAIVNTGRQVEVRYTPAPGYVGPDRFTATWWPFGSAVTTEVTVMPR